MKLYALVDKKSSVAEYFVASCDEDAMRISTVMMLSSRPIYEFADDFAVLKVHDLPTTRACIADDVIVDGGELRRQLEARRKEREENAEG